MGRARIAIFFGLVVASALLLSACPKPNGYKATPVFPGIQTDQMTGMFPVPGDGNFALILSKSGVIYRANLDTPNAQPTTFMDVRDKLIQNPGEEEGLLGLAFAPDYASSGKFYIVYSAGNPRRDVLARFVASGDRADPGSERVLLEIGEPYSNHNGGNIVFGPDRYLYFGVGDGGGGGDTMGNGQNVNTLLGKILRIDVSGADYTIPPDNPFARGGGRPEIYAWGFRNPWRFSFDSRTGHLWVADVGQDLWEEVDHVERGQNYGWNIMEGAHCFNPSSGCNMSGLALPRAEYGHDVGCSITGGYVYRGKALPEMDGWFVYSDFCSGRVWAVNTTENASKPIQLMDSGQPVSSFMQGKDGELYLVTFANAIYKIERK
ncbi:MAG: PQQ-dependent sugar dehydrogenase [Dehalococcoidia bacterium]|nr:PQQ-dependent sugar dehydrogenase [Dehalococcoidia bacterium]